MINISGCVQSTSQHTPAQTSTAQYSPLQPSTVHYNPVQSNTAQNIPVAALNISAQAVILVVTPATKSPFQKIHSLLRFVEFGMVQIKLHSMFKDIYYH